MDTIKQKGSNRGLLLVKSFYWPLMKFRCRFAPLEGAVAHCGPSKGWVLVGTVVQVSIPIIDQLGQGGNFIPYHCCMSKGLDD